MAASLSSVSFSTLKRWALGRAVVGMAGGVRMAPASAVSRLGSALGDALYFGSPRYRSVALSNLKWAFGEEWTEKQIVAVARESFRNMGKSAVEFLRMPALTEADIRRLAVYDGLENLTAGLARGKGCILISAHFGNWEIMCSRASLDGYRISVIVRDADDPGANRLINEIREKHGYRVLSRDQSLRPAIQALRGNEIIGILADQNTLQGVFVPFFGKLASTATGPAALARATGAAVVPVFTLRQPDDTHRIVVHPALDIQITDNKEADLYRITAQITAAIEEAVRAHPTQWLWIHNRWKRRPTPEEAQAAREVMA